MQKGKNDLLTCCEALSNDPTNERLIDDVKNAALNSAIKDEFILCLELISKANGDEDAFLLCSMIGQKYLHINQPKEATRCLESALRIDTKNLNWKSSVVSSLAYAYWSCNDTNLAVVYMQQDLLLAKQTNDWQNMFRSYGNLGSVCYCEGEYHKSIAFRRLQLHMAFKLKSISKISEVLSHLGHVSCATGDYTTALSCHQRCVVLFQKLNDKLSMAKEISNVGVIHLLESNFTQAITCHKEHLKISKELKQKAEEARAYSNLGSCYHFAGNFKKSIECHEKVKAISIKLGDELFKFRAYAGLGHAYRCQGNYSQAKVCHEKQLDISLNCHDKSGEGKACSNLGVIYQLCGEFEAAFKLHEKHLNISTSLGDLPSQARAHANIGIALSSMGNYQSSVEAHKKELKIFRKIKDLRSECSTLSNLAFAYEGHGMRKEALTCYEQHLKIVRNLKDVSKEMQALLKLANYQCVLKDYAKALPFYQQHLTLSQQVGSLQGKLLSLHGIGYTNFHMERFKEAIDYYLLDLESFKGLMKIAASSTNEDMIAAIKQNVIKCSESDKLHLCHIFCNLGLSYAAFNELEKATLLQQNFLDLSGLLSQNKTIMFCALGNLGDIGLQTNDLKEAKKYFELQLQIAKKYKEKKLEALACNNLGVVYYKMEDYKNSLDFVNKELKLNRDLQNAKGEVRTLLFIGHLQIATKCYKEAQLTFTEGLRQSKMLDFHDKSLTEEAELLGCLAACCLKQKNYDLSLNHLKKEMLLIDRLPVSFVNHFKRQANLDAGICCALLRNFHESINYYEKYFEHSTGLAHHEMKACRLLAEAHDECGNLHETILYCRKGFLFAIKYKCLDTLAYFSLHLGLICKKMGCYNLASSFLIRRLDYDIDVIDHNQEIRTRDSLGQVLMELKKFQEAQESYDKLLQLCQQKLNYCSNYIFKAHYCLATCLQHLGDLEKALMHMNKCLNISMKSGSVSQKLKAILLIALLYYELDMSQKSMEYFEEGLELLNLEKSPSLEDERKFRQCLGFVYWKQKKYNFAKKELLRAVHIIEDRPNILKEKLSFIEDLNPFAALNLLLKVLIDMKQYKEALMYSENVRQMKTCCEFYETQNSKNCKMITSLLSPLLTLSCNSDKMSSLMLLNDDDFLSLSPDVPHFNNIKHVSSFLMLEEAVNAQSSAVLCFSLGLHFLYSWLLLPGQGLVKYYETDITTFTTKLENDLQSLSSRSNLSLLDFTPSRSAFKVWNRDQPSLEPISNSQDCLTFSSSFTETLHKNREVGSILENMQKSNFSKIISESQLLMSFMFNLFIGPFDEILNSNHTKGITFVIESELFNIPFSILRPNSFSPFLFQKYHINFISSFKYLLSLKGVHRESILESTTNNDTRQSVPLKLDHAVLVNGTCHSKAKAKMLNDIEKMLQGKVLTHCRKEDVVNALLNAEMIHLSCNLVDQSFALILDSSSMKKSQISDQACGDFFFTLSDVLNLKAHTTFVVLDVISNCLEEGITGDSVKKFADALLESGVKCVFVPLWTVGGEAAEHFFKTFYLTLAQGYSVLTSLHHTMAHMRSHHNFASMKNWACWTLIGNDVAVHGRTGLLQKGLVEILKSYEKPREAMRILLHLIEKSLKRIEEESTSSMFVTKESILKRIGDDCFGWEEVMRAAGFKFVIDDSSQSILVFFPLDDDFQYLKQSSLALSSFLGLSISLLENLSHFAHLKSVGSELLNEFCEMLKNRIQSNVLKISKATFDANSVADFLYQLDFLVISRTSNTVIFNSKSLNSNLIVLVVTSLAFLFDPHRFAQDKCWVENLVDPHICLEYSPSQQLSSSSSRKKHSIDSGCMSFETSNVNLTPNHIRQNGFSSQKYDSIDESSVSTAYAQFSVENIETDSGTHTWSKNTDTNDNISYYSHLTASQKKYTTCSNLSSQGYTNSKNMTAREFTRINAYFAKQSSDESQTESRI